MKKKTVIISVIVAAVLFIGVAATLLTVFNKKEQPITYPTNLSVNLLSSAYGVDKDDLRFSWAMNDTQTDSYQKAYRAVVAKSKDDFEKGEFLFDSGRVESNLSSSVSFDGLSQLLEYGKLYYFAVSTENDKGFNGGFSKPFAFRVADNDFGGKGIWAADENGKKTNDDFVFLRTEFSLDEKKYENLDKAVLSVTARSPEPSRQFVYNLYVNGNSAGAGPSRINTNANGEKELYYDNREVKEYLKKGDNAIGVVCYTLSDKAFYARLTAFYKDGSSEVLSSVENIGEWKSLGGDKAFGKSNSIGTGYFTAHANNVNSEYFPFGFSQAGFNDGDWKTAIATSDIAAGVKLCPANTEPVKRFLSNENTMAFTEMGNSVVVDLGYEIVGSLYLNIVVPFETTVNVRYGEQLNPDGSVKWKMLTGNEYSETFTFSPGSYEFETIDLMTFRYIEFCDTSITLNPSTVRGVELRADFDENDSAFSSDEQLLNEIYDLVKRTAKITTQDLFVDSQSRERRAYEGDCVINQPLSYAFSRNYAASRFSAEYLYINRTWPADYVLFCSRMAYSDYLYTGDEKSLSEYYEVLKTKTFTKYFDSSVNLVTAGGVTQSSVENCILVDWPETERDGYDMNVKFNTVLNAIAVRSYEDLSKIATVLGKTDDATAFSGYAEKIRTAMVEKLYDAENGGFFDGLYSNGKPSQHKSQHATAFALSACIVDGNKALRSANFIASSGKIKTSVYGSFFLFEGLYNADKADVANSFLIDDDVSDGARTWAYMIRTLDATLTTEAWNPVNKDNMTFSHPWGASPAYAITNGIFGIKPTAKGFSEFEVKFATAGLNKASLTIPCIKGKISASFDKSGNKSVYSVFVPANTTATVFVPMEQGKTLYLDGKAVEAENDGLYFKFRLGSGNRNLEVK